MRFFPPTLNLIICFHMNHIALSTLAHLCMKNDLGVGHSPPKAAHPYGIGNHS